MKGKLVSLIPDMMHKRRVRSVDLQKESGLSSMTIHTIANGAIPKTSKTLEKLCGAFNCQPNDLMRFIPKESE